MLNPAVIFYNAININTMAARQSYFEVVDILTHDPLSHLLVDLPVDKAQNAVVRIKRAFPL